MRNQERRQTFGFSSRNNQFIDEELVLIFLKWPPHLEEVIQPFFRVPSVDLILDRFWRTESAYSITETAPLFCRHTENKRRALVRVQDLYLPNSWDPGPPRLGFSDPSASAPWALDPTFQTSGIWYTLWAPGAPVPPSILIFTWAPIGSSPCLFFSC